MIKQAEESAKPVAAAHLRWWLLGLGLIPLGGTAMLAARLIWEQTALTWELGPQMVGFSLAHGSGAILLVAPLLLAPWTVLAFVVIVRDLLKRRRSDTPTLATFGVALLLFGLLSMPSGVWERLFIGRMASSPRAADLLADAAYKKDLPTVKGMLAHGVSVAAIDRSDWRTALHAGAVIGDLRLVQFLVSKGANVNALDRSGDSPVELAVSQGNNDCAKFLQEHGGKRIRGDEAQHEKASDDKVQEDIEEMERSQHR
jgi:hypothetical protein